MSHRREQKEALRREREERERKAREAEQRKKLVGYVLGGFLALAALVVVILLATGGDSPGDEAAASVFPEGGSLPEQREFDVEPAAEAAGCELIATKARGEEDRLHTDAPDVDVKYRGNPPTLGRHWPPGFQAQDGLYGETPADEALVHTMEHGRVVIWAKPSLPEDARATLRAMFDDDEYQMVLTPRRNMPFAVAATAWNAEPEPVGTGRTLGCPEWNDRVTDALRAFRDEHRSRGPEPVP